MRHPGLLLALALSLPAPGSPPSPAEFVQAVEFPYYLYPRQLWERELVWLKNIGVRTVEFSIPANWHRSGEGDFDFTGRTSPRRDLMGFIRLLRRLDLHAWVRPQGEGRKELSQLLATQTASHGGPIACVEGRGLAIDAPPPPRASLRFPPSSPEPSRAAAMPWRLTYPSLAARWCGPTWRTRSIRQAGPTLQLCYARAQWG